MYYAAVAIYGNGLRTTNEDAICHSDFISSCNTNVTCCTFLGTKYRKDNKHLIQIGTDSLGTDTYENTLNFVHTIIYQLMSQNTIKQL